MTSQRLRAGFVTQNGTAPRVGIVAKRTDSSVTVVTKPLPPQPQPDTLHASSVLDLSTMLLLNSTTPDNGGPVQEEDALPIVSASSSSSTQGIPGTDKAVNPISLVPDKAPDIMHPQQQDGGSKAGATTTTIGATTDTVGTDQKRWAWSEGLVQCATILKNPSCMEELVYWHPHPQEDWKHINPIHHDPLNTFLTFEPDTSIGFSSQRMVLEHMVILAYATGRTLVLPPKWGSPRNDGTLLSFEDFFDLRLYLSQSYASINIITMQEFLQFVAMGGHLHSVNHKNKNEPLYPPHGNLVWDNSERIGDLYLYLREVGHVPYTWDYQHCFLGIARDETDLRSMLSGVWKSRDGRPPPHDMDFQGRPTPVQAPVVERLREFAAQRQKLCHYEVGLASSTLLHIPTTSEGTSLLHTTPYTFVFFENWHQDLFAKRLVRDGLRYNDVIQCAAARVVDALRASSVGTYHALHIRGPSFENAHSEVAVDPLWILRQVQPLLLLNNNNNNSSTTVLYIATDVTDQEKYFRPFREAGFQLLFASDFAFVFDALLPHYMEMVEQIVCARADVFVGTYHSSFTGYIARLRGYYGQRDKFPEDGYQDGDLPTTYYHSPPSAMKEMRLYRSIRPPFTMREFPVAWRDLDHAAS